MLEIPTHAIVYASTLLLITTTAMSQQARNDAAHLCEACNPYPSVNSSFHVDSSKAKRGHLITAAAAGFPTEVGQVIDLLVSKPDNPQLKRACMLQIDGSNVPCDTVWYINFKDGAESIQFNKGAGRNPIASFFGKHRDIDIISIDGIALKVDQQSQEAKASGECIVSKSKNGMGCQARIDDGRLVIGTIFLDKDD